MRIPFHRPIRLAAGFLALALILHAPPAQAARRGGAEKEDKPAYASAILMEAETGKVLFEDNADAPHIPASVVKLMVMLLAAEAVEKKVVPADAEVEVSAEASRMGGSQVYLKHHEKMTFEELFKAVAIASANDAAYAIAEHMAGSAEAFVDLMNQRAKELGMKNTVYRSVHGLPPGREDRKADTTTARDTAILAREAVRHPFILKWTSVREDSLRDGKFILHNTNARLLRTFRGMDGLKTGYYDEAGFNLCATAVRGGMRLISVVFGAPTRRGRERETSKLLLRGFRLYRKAVFFGQGTPVPAPVAVEDGKQKTVRVAPAETVRVIVERAKAAGAKTKVEVSAPLKAPVKKGQAVGEMIAMAGGEVLAKTKLVALEDVAAKTWLDRIMFWRK